MLSVTGNLYADKKMEDKEIKKLIDIAYNIIDENPGVLLSGSLALHELGIKLRRKPTDIDLYLPYGQKFQPIEGMTVSLIETDEDYENLYYERSGFKIGNVSIDVFTPIEPQGELKLTDEQSNTMLAAHLIIGFKVQHSLADAWTAQKHKMDLIHIVANN